MDVLDFIEQETIKDSKCTLRRSLLFGGCVALIAVGLGLGLREDFRGVENPGHLLPNAFAALCLVLIPIFYSLKAKFPGPIRKIILVTLALAFFFASWRVFSPWEASTTYGSSQEFWIESKKCFFKGGFAAAVTGSLFLYVFLNFFSQLSRSWMFIFSVLVAVSSTVMLGFHCDSSSLGHVLAGHLLPGALIGLGVWGLQEALFMRKLRKVFPNLIKRISHPQRLG